MPCVYLVENGWKRAACTASVSKNDCNLARVRCECGSCDSEACVQSLFAPLEKGPDVVSWFLRKPWKCWATRNKLLTCVSGWGVRSRGRCSGARQRIRSSSSSSSLVQPRLLGKDAQCVNSALLTAPSRFLHHCHQFHFFFFFLLLN